MLVFKVIKCKNLFIFILSRRLLQSSFNVLSVFLKCSEMLNFSEDILTKCVNDLSRNGMVSTSAVNLNLQQTTF